MTFQSLLTKLSNSSGFLSKVARSFEVLSELSKGFSKLLPIWTTDEANVEKNDVINLETQSDD